jgi:hypothetical protein
VTIFAIAIFIIMGSFKIGLKQEPAIVLSKTGIDLTSVGYFPWEGIASFSIVKYYESGSEDLVLHLFENTEGVFIPIHSLDKTCEEITSLIIEISGSEPNFFAGCIKK